MEKVINEINCILCQIKYDLGSLWNNSEETNYKVQRSAFCSILILSSAASAVALSASFIAILVVPTLLAPFIIIPIAVNSLILVLHLSLHYHMRPKKVEEPAQEETIANAASEISIKPDNIIEEEPHNDSFFHQRAATPPVSDDEFDDLVRQFQSPKKK